ncbi:MAG: hypothetical protein H7122_16370 [Chitinophagaceae bacterium]|nr:hypothetical protein [Chitinophagaceae bacterium]
MGAELNRYNQAQHIALRAEAFCAALLDNGAFFDSLTIEFAGSFRRTYRNDIDNVSIENGDRKNDKISLVLNRDGIYDKLPEGLFHQSLGSGRVSALKDMIGEHRRYKEEEKAARKFFQPIQQEIFRFAVMAEQEERNILFGTLNGQVSEAFFRFWDISEDLPLSAAEIMIRLMPMQKRIKGDKKLIAKALQLALNKQVSVAETTVEQQQHDNTIFRTGDGSMLGLDTITGNVFAEPSRRWTFTIHDLTASETAQYCDNKPFGKFLQRFTEIFLPLEIETKFEFEPEEETGEKEREYIIGYGFYL